MAYELELLDRLVVGDLSPAHFRPDEASFYRQKLHERFHFYHRHFKVEFEQVSADEYAYLRHSEYRFRELDRLPRLNDETANPDLNALSRLLGLAMPRLGLTYADIQYAAFCSFKSISYLEITAAADLGALPAGQARYYYYHTLLTDEVGRLRPALAAGALACRKPSERTGYVQQHQAALNQLLTYLLAELEPAGRHQLYTSPVHFTLGDVYRLCYTQIEQIMLYLEQTFPDHLNLAAPLPYLHRVVSLADTQQQLPVVQAALAAPELPAELTSPVLRCLQRLSAVLSDNSLSYQEALYARLLLSELHQRVQRGWVITPARLAWLLIRCNFNAVGVFAFITSYIQQEAQAAGSAAEQLAVLARYRKLYKQLQVNTGIPYVATMPPLRRQILCWLKEEQRYIRQCQPPLAAPPAPAPAVAPLVTPLSVAQLTYLFRALKEAGVFQVDNQQNLFRFLSAYVRTLRAGEITASSINAKYYNIEESTREAVKDVVIKMLNYVRHSPKN